MYVKAAQGLAWILKAEGVPLVACHPTSPKFKGLRAGVMHR
jgi:hypothetical protein